jgi:hypothetical protein
MRSRSLTPYVPRRPARHAVRLPCQVVRERDFKLIADEMLELSDGGMLVVPKLRVLTGESIVVSFMAPFSRSYIDAEGTVARVLHGRRVGDPGPTLGLSLVGLDPTSRAIVQSQLAFLPTVAPRTRMFS